MWFEYPITCLQRIDMNAENNNWETKENTLCWMRLPEKFSDDLLPPSHKVARYRYMWNWKKNFMFFSETSPWIAFFFCLQLILWFDSVYGLLCYMIYSEMIYSWITILNNEQIVCETPNSNTLLSDYKKYIWRAYTWIFPVALPFCFISNKRRTLSAKAGHLYLYFESLQWNFFPRK